jgi:CDP-paratose 2-epimerase
MSRTISKSVPARREQIEALLESFERLTLAPTGHHLTEDEFISYVSGDMKEEVATRIDHHLSSCEECSIEMERLFAVSKDSAEVRDDIARNIQQENKVARAFRKLTDIGAKSEKHPNWVLITGGAGFIGSHLADALASAGRRVRLFDNLSRAGVEKNLRWLQETHGDRITFEVGDVRDVAAVRSAMVGVETVFHLAANVAVNTSWDDPVYDFDVNTRGTLNVLEAVRTQIEPPALLFTSTNKVYGEMEDVCLRLRGLRYEPKGHLRRCGFSEERRLDFHSPYGCSKGSADQYVLDYARSYGLRTAVFRMSCIYGPHQFGTEDQGWVAHFLIRALDDQPITLYGDGMQVRDVLFVGDLVQALLHAERHIGEISGQAFNLGGGPGNTISLLELIDLIGQIHGREPVVTFYDWRASDQRWYVSNTRKFEAATGWRPCVSVREGVSRLYNWLQDQVECESSSLSSISLSREVVVA